MNTETLAHGLSARRNGSSWMAKCPAHRDNNPSLSIDDKDGKPVVHCHAGCSQRDVIDALKGLGLWDAGRGPGGPPDLPSPITARYDYWDERGDLLYAVTRHEPTANERKPFRPCMIDERGKWVHRKHPRQVLYRLPEVLAAPIVFLVEGEKDVETLRAHGFRATTKAGGAKSPWLPNFTDTLRGRQVIVLPDNDQPGRECALRVALALQGAAASLIVLELDGGKDVTDWFNLGHDETELLALIEKPQVRH